MPENVAVIVPLQLVCEVVILVVPMLKLVQSKLRLMTFSVLPLISNDPLKSTEISLISGTAVLSNPDLGPIAAPEEVLHP